MRICILIAFVLLSLCSFGQNITISGKIIDEVTHQPLPFATIQIEKTGIGTIANNDGRFTLKVDSRYHHYTIQISSLGYKSQRKGIHEIKSPILVPLQPADNELGEVVIMPKNTLLDLLRKAYKKIPENYPTHPTELKGFYRETLKTPKDQYLYFSEAVTDTYKSSYNVDSDDGQVKILKSMVNAFPLADTLFKNTYFYGGAFSGNNDDFVKKRYDFINPRHFDRYNYTLKGLSNYQGSNVYVINFDTQNDTLKGTMEGTLYIEQTSLAYVACVYSYTKRGVDNCNFLKLSPYKVISYNSSVNFIKYKDVWHIKYITSEQIGINTTHKTNLILNSEYIATEIKTDSVKPIPFEKRLEFTDNFSQKAASYYSDDYWSEYNVLDKDTILNNQIKPLYSTEQSKGLLTMKVNLPKENPLFQILRNISAVNGIGYSSVRTGSDQFIVSYINQNKLIKFAGALDPVNYLLYFNTQISYSLSKRWGVDLTYSKSLGNNAFISSKDIGVSYKFLMNRKTRPLILKTSISYSYSDFARSFQISDNKHGAFSFGGKTIDADKIQFSIGQRRSGIKPKICLQYKVSKFLWLNASAGYVYDLNTSDRLYVNEKSGFFLTRKLASLDLSDHSLDVSNNGAITTKSDFKVGGYSYDIGLMLKM